MRKCALLYTDHWLRKEGDCLGFFWSRDNREGGSLRYSREGEWLGEQGKVLEEAGVNAIQSIGGR